MIDWTKYLSAPPTMKPNKMEIPVNRFSTSEADIDEFNTIYQHCYELEQKGELHQFVKTQSNGISIKRGNICGAMWGLWQSKIMTMIILRNPEDCRYYKFQIGYTKAKDDAKGKGRNAFLTYKSELAKNGVDLETYALQGEKEENLEIKKTIENPPIKCLVPFRLTLYNAHHIDLNSSFQAGISKAYPEFKPTIESIYAKRKENPVYKDILNMTQGFMQSELLQYRFCHISKAGIDWNNKRIRELAEKLESSGRRILSFNTDGIWYQGDIYHDEDEGTALGQWKNDHVNCKIRYKSHGCYEFVENEVYKPVFRGESSYERIKPKEEWVWGDIFMGDVIKFSFVEGVGIIKHDYT